jgi:hypothetical protein
MQSPTTAPEAKGIITDGIRLYPLPEDWTPEEEWFAYFKDWLVWAPEPKWYTIRTLQIDESGYPVSSMVWEGPVLFHGKRLSGTWVVSGRIFDYMPADYQLLQMMGKTQHGIEPVGSLHVSKEDRTLRRVTIGSRTFLIGRASVPETFNGTTLFEAFEIKPDGTLEYNSSWKLVSSCSIEIGINWEVLSKVNDVERQIQRRVESLIQETV